ncbi:hypothetical protein [Tenacibaculum sp. 190524A02b]|uniref:hypothetical protein n=1 Tax=Tenacibaculum vairaonense TaxID=3137860 RepID=UPI0031FB3EE6
MSEQIDLRVQIELSGEYAHEVTKEELKEYLEFELQGGRITNRNPLISDDYDVEVSNVYLH